MRSLNLIFASITLAGISALHAKPVKIIYNGASNPSIENVISSNQNFAYQGEFQSFDGELTGEWIVGGFNSEVAKTQPKISVMEVEGNNVITLNNQGFLTQYLATNIAVKPSKRYGIYCETKESGSHIAKNEELKELGTQLRINYKLYDSGMIEAYRSSYSIISESRKDGWISNFVIIELNSELQDIIETINLTFTLKQVNTSIRNLRLIALEDTQLTTLKNKKKKYDNGRMSLTQIMENKQFIRSIWNSRPISETDASAFYTHYIQGALELTDNDTQEKITNKSLSIEQLEKLANQTRSKKNLKPVKFK
jgi:hypothetical protein